MTYRITFVHPCIGRKPGQSYLKTWTMEPLTLAVLAARTPPEVTLNFFDDSTHIKPVTTGQIAYSLRDVGLDIESSGVARNWLFAAAYPLLRLTPPSRKRYVAQTNWIGWSAYVVARMGRP